VGERRASDACADDEDVVMRVHVAFFLLVLQGATERRAGQVYVRRLEEWIAGNRDRLKRLGGLISEFT